MDLSKLSDRELFGRVELHARNERGILADFLVYLSELDKRRCCEPNGYSSVYMYLTRHLGLAESDAARRLRAARACAAYPRILTLLRGGKLHLMGVAMLQPVLTSENYRKVVRQAMGKSKREIERLVADLSPAVLEPRDTIRALPCTIGPRTVPVKAHERSLPGLGATEEAANGSEGLLELPPPPPKRVLISFAADEQAQDLLALATALMRHKFPEGRIEEVFCEALKRLCDQELPGERNGVRKGIAENGMDRSRRIPEWVKAVVWRRDKARCSFVAPDGTHCCEKDYLEYDHKKPYSQGGASDNPDNIRLLCRAHNAMEARRLLGERANLRRHDRKSESAPKNGAPRANGNSGPPPPANGSALKT